MVPKMRGVDVISPRRLSGPVWSSGLPKAAQQTAGGPGVTEPNLGLILGEQKHRRHTKNDHLTKEDLFTANKEPMGIISKLGSLCAFALSN